eukprot:gene782-biopygen6050
MAGCGFEGKVPPASRALHVRSSKAAVRSSQRRGQLPALRSAPSAAVQTGRVACIGELDRRSLASMLDGAEAVRSGGTGTGGTVGKPAVRNGTIAESNWRGRRRNALERGRCGGEGADGTLGKEPWHSWAGRSDGCEQPDFPTFPILRLSSPLGPLGPLGGVRWVHWVHWVRWVESA